ncbi:AAA family ATPase [Staphylococcus canis]|uniref:AAA family ATPase n=1 Tax=Staphylococcus canis TaxID=2724942 RepID=A0ABS0TAK6_9STAP|nr:AAA family ATPase [Staphylococcus canis]MBI5975781.1 AAA family ATPase [Staphylococcus canis]
MYSVNNLSFKYSKKCQTYTLHHINFQLKTGKLNVLLGENGSGKTTIMDCMTDILEAKHHNQLPKTNEMVYLTQNMMLSPHTTGADIQKLVKGMASKHEVASFDNNITTFINDSKSVKEKYHHLLNMTSGKMSIGERRWFYILLFAALDRKLYILDEPTSSIDPRARKMILSRLLELCKSKTVLISTHQLQDLPIDLTNIIFINNGEKLYEGAYDEWLKQMETENPDIAFERTIHRYEISRNDKDE